MLRLDFLESRFPLGRYLYGIYHHSNSYNAHMGHERLDLDLRKAIPGFQEIARRYRNWANILVGNSPR